MKTVFLIGNGFDINLGLKTGYHHFFKHLFNKPHENAAIEQFKVYLKHNKDKNSENWADLEVILGKYSTEFPADRANDYIAFLDAIHEELRQYIGSVAKDIEISNEGRREFTEDLFHYDIYLNERDREQFLSYQKALITTHHTVSAIVFNYTWTFEKAVRYEAKSIDFGRCTEVSAYHNYFSTIEHVHGYLNNNMLVGVNDLSQIENKELRENNDVTTRIIKPKMNSNSGSLREKRCLTLLYEADVICVFGMSIGPTDKKWWAYIIKRLVESNARLIIFSIKDDISPSTAYLLEPERDKIKKRLLSYGNLTETQRERVLNKIFIAFNTKIFKIKPQLQKAS